MGHTGKNGFKTVAYGVLIASGNHFGTWLQVKTLRLYGFAAIRRSDFTLEPR